MLWGIMGWRVRGMRRVRRVMRSEGGVVYK
jgi:hypothetical protein